MIFTIQAPYAVDSKGNTIECEYVFSKEENNVLTLRTPTSWLETAEYPVKIDPTMVTYFLETDDRSAINDNFGISVAVGDFNGDGYADILSGAPNNDIDNDADGGRAYIFYGPITADDNSANVTLGYSNATFQNYGTSVGVGDFNGDGYDDAVVGGMFVDVCIIYGSSTLSGLYSTPDVKVREVTSSSRFGIAIASGNLDGDSNDDLIIGAPDDFDNFENGKVFIYYYDSSDWGDGLIDSPPDDELHSLSNINFGYEFGYSVTIGNFYSGTLDDIAVGEPRYGAQQPGRINLFDGDFIDDNGPTSDIPTNYIDNPQLGADGDFDLFGFSIAAGDFNPDATTDDFDDVVVGEPSNDVDAADAGQLQIFTCDDDPSGWITNNTFPVIISNPEGASGDNDQFGYAVGAGDVYGDGFDDFYGGAPFSDNGGSVDDGAIYIFDCDGTTIPTTYLNAINGTSTDDERLGWSVAGDKFANDSVYVLAAGAPYWHDGPPKGGDSGRVWVMQVPEFTGFEITIVIGMILLININRKKRKKGIKS
jgi:hypothetical protein